tara:strand:+ start:181 stop:366 length:186 start_codon:yes stop_codon:yes gene_type:complete
VPIALVVIPLLLVKKESSLILKVKIDKKIAKDKRNRSEPLNPFKIFANLPLKTSGIKLLFI